MTSDDKTLISLLLDGEADSEQVKAALALLEAQPELMAFFQRQQWLRAHWKQEYLGAPVDLSQGIWDALDAEPVVEEGNVVDELALRREAKLADQLSAQREPAQESERLYDTHGQHQSSAQGGDQMTAMPRRPRSWLQLLAQGAVAAAVCFAMVGLWYVQPNASDVKQPQVAVSQSSQDNRAIRRETVNLDDYEALDGSRLVMAGGVAPLAKGTVEAGLLLASDSHESRFVSLEKLRQQERARLANYYMMHTGNSAMLEPMQGVQLVRMVDSQLLQVPRQPESYTTQGD